MKISATHDSGYTLAEMLLVIAIGGVLTALAATSFPNLLKNNQMVGDVNSLVGHINLARSEAVKRNLPTTVCQTNNPQAATPSCNNATAGWDQGWLVFIDDDDDRVYDPADGERILQRGEPSGNVDMVVGAGNLAFARDGFLSTGRIFFSLCDDRGINHGRQLSLSVTGRPEINKTFAANTDCDDATP